MSNVEIAFIIITFLSIVGLSLATSNHKGVISLFAGWSGVVGILSYSGFFENTERIPPRFLLVIIPAFAITVYAYKLVKTPNLCVPWLIAIHIVRIPVELVLFQIYLQSLIPELMTFKGWNWDILSGLSAILILWFHLRHNLSRRILLIWNWAALALLAIIVVSAILSAPTPIQQLAFEQPNLALLQFPYTWLPAVVVPIVLLSHLYVIRYLNVKEPNFSNSK